MSGWPSRRGDVYLPAVLRRKRPPRPSVMSRWDEDARRWVTPAWVPGTDRSSDTQ